MPVCLIGLGSNQGNREELLATAVARLAAHTGITIRAQSAWRETSPIGGPSEQTNFLNGAALLETSLGPHELLAVLSGVEDELGRRRTHRWGPRTIDLDLLLYDDLILNAPSLVLPHPRLAVRRFVLEPAAEVAGDMLHPAIRWTIAQLLRHLDTPTPYLAFTGPIAAGKTQLAHRLADAVSARLLLERPNWHHLDAFYADPATHGLETELEFLHQRARLLGEGLGGNPASGGADIPVFPKRGIISGRQECLPHRGQESLPHHNEKCGPRRWTVSDFWFDQSAAFARAWLPDVQLPVFQQEFDRLRPTVARPTLVVLLDLPAKELLGRVCRRRRQCEKRLTEDQLERIRQAIVEQSSLPNLGPVLRLPSDDPDAAFAEVLAAVRGME